MLQAASSLGILATHTAILSRIKTNTTKTIITLPLTFGLLLLSDAGQKYFSRMFEWQADQSINNDPIVLNATADWMEDQALNEKKSLLDCFRSHPYSAARAKRFRERATQLEQQK